MQTAHCIHAVVLHGVASAGGGSGASDAWAFPVEYTVLLQTATTWATLVEMNLCEVCICVSKVSYMRRKLSETVSEQYSCFLIHCLC